MAKYAFIFPGQGSQSVGMLQSYLPAATVITQTFQEASDVLGYDAWQLAQDGPAEKLNDTRFTQPVLLTASVALWRLWQAQSRVQPEFLAGHSLGEYSALVASGAVSFADGLRLVHKRAELMSAAVPAGDGAMAAILGLDDEQVKLACLEAAAEHGIVEAVNFNAPGQVVIAGAKAAVDVAIENCKAAGAKRAMPLAVSVPSHCQLMKTAAEHFSAILNQTEINTPDLPVIQNVGVNHFSHPDDIRHALHAQLYNPVPWVQTIQFLVEQGVTHTVECGPGKVLSGLNKRIDKSLTSIVLNTADDFAAAVQ